VAFGVLGGLLGGYVFLRFIPAIIPTSKQSVLVQQSSAAIDVAKKVSPSVVSITSQSTGFSFFGTNQTTQGAGTGIIASSDGLIVTNNHVVEGADNLTVFTSDGKEYKNAKVVARDASNDLAFVQISASNLKPADFGDSSGVKVGSEVIAIGNALGQFQNTVTLGIISGIGRPVAAYLGVRYIPVTKEFAASNNLPVNNGAYVSGDSQNAAVVGGSPAAQAGLKEGDIITKIGSQTLDENHSLSSVIGQHKVGDKLKVTYYRDGKQHTTDVTLQEAPQQ
jgi:S1-C subfamily serine protease